MIALFAATLAACPSSPDDRARRGDPSRTHGSAEGSSAEPVSGGSVVVGVLGAPASLDPYSPVASDLTRWLAGPVYPMLFRFLPDGSVRDDLASSIVRIPGGVRVQLRRARWSDGRPITAGDVVASARRASRPSGFARVESVRAIGPRTVEIRGAAPGWRRVLATSTFVLPRGRPRAAFGGPFVRESATPGFDVVYSRNPGWFRGEALLDRVTVRFVERLDILLALLEERRVDVAVPPSAVNLDERLEALRVEHGARLGWESVYLDLEGSDLERAQRAALFDAVDRNHLEEGFVRDDGRVANTLVPRPGDGGAGGRWARVRVPGNPPTGVLQLGAPVGDELLEFLQRPLQRALAGPELEIELVTVDAAVFYGSWARTDPIDIALRRRLGAPGMPSGGRALKMLSSLPLFHVESFIAWRGDVHGPAPNPTIEGPLWNLARWWKDRQR